MEFKRRLKNIDSDLRLDWLHKDGPPDALRGPYNWLVQAEKPFREATGYRFRSGLAIIICLFMPVLWYINQQLSALADTPKKPGNNLIQILPGGYATPSFPLVTRKSDPAEAGKTTLAEYIGAFNTSVYAGRYSSDQISAFYYIGIPVDYLNKLQSGGYLQELTFPAIIACYKAGITVDYLDQMKENGFLRLFPYSAFAAFYDNGVSVDFLQKLKEKDLLEDLTFVDVLVMFKHQ